MITTTTINQTPAAPAFVQLVSAALGQLKEKLQRDYARAYPNLREMIHLILDQEEARAWQLSIFPHLVFPDLVETHVAKLTLQPAETKHAQVLTLGPFAEPTNYQPVLALCV